MASHESLVELIFSKLSLVYGRDFLGRWEGQNLSEVQADWMRELGPSLNYPEAIRYALEHLPEKPPNVIQFRALCISRPEPAAKALPAPKASDEAVKRAMAAIGPKSDVDPKSWAYRLRTDERGGLRLTSAQRMMWREALKNEGASA